MMLAIIVLGTVGGALAYRVKSPVPAYCVAPITTIACNACLVLGYTMAAGNEFHYTATNDCGDCLLLTCPKTGRAVKE